jgi:hypothetical protein
MFGPSLKSVPGCLVSIVPMLIGVPVAFTPGFGPQLDVSLDEPLELAAAVELVAELDALLALLLAPGAEDVLLLLLPQPASTAAPMSAPSAMIVRMRSACLYINLTCVLLLVLIRSTRPGWRGDDPTHTTDCMQCRPNVTTTNDCMSSLMCFLHTAE